MCGGGGGSGGGGDDDDYMSILGWMEIRLFECIICWPQFEFHKI